jgi:hypothetical protein
MVLFGFVHGRSLYCASVPGAAEGWIAQGNEIEQSRPQELHHLAGPDTAIELPNRRGRIIMMRFSPQQHWNMAKRLHRLARTAPPLKRQRLLQAANRYLSLARLSARMGHDPTLRWLR